ncbi:MAG: hypothetical protein V4640_06770, partial [Verrucomicrobiota bacterium]
MPSYLIPISIMATVVSVSAIFAVVMDRFRNPMTDMAVLIGGISPWVAMAGMYRWLPSSGYILAVGLFGSGDLFSLA